MWVSTAVWLKGMEDAIQLRVERDSAIQQAKQQEVTLSWFMHRLTQVEKERAQLIYNFTGVKTDAPAYEEENRIPSGVENPLNALPSFDGLDDIEAAKQGIGWDDEGKIIYGITK